MRPKIFLTVNNHFDLMWRRCFRKRFTSGGQSYLSYADIEENYILANLDLAERVPEYKFQIESIAVLREFLRRNPERLPQLQKLWQEDRFLVPGSGDNIVDSNMVLGESIVRNYLIGEYETLRLFGSLPKVADRMDAFGNSTQLPQIINGFGMKYVDGLIYTLCDEPVWRGLDGSELTQISVPVVGKGGHYAKYPPCPVCNGEGTVEGKPCSACGQSCFDSIADRMWKPIEIDEEALAQYGVGRVTAGDEELRPNPDTLEWYERAKDTYDVKFASFDDMIAATDEIVAKKKAAGEPIVSDMLELNPNNSGCFTSRIETKQTCRRQEYALLAAEMLSAAAALRGADYPAEQLLSTWQDLLFTMFHDAITGTHIDAANDELREIWEQIDCSTAAVREKACAALAQPADDVLSVVNPTGNPQKCVVEMELPGAVCGLTDTNGAALPCDCTAGEEGTKLRFVAEVPAFHTAAFTLRKGEPEAPAKLETAAIENEFYRITADESGVLEVFDKRLGKALTTNERYRPFEFLLWHDEGSPWATLSSDGSVQRLSPCTHLVSTERTAAQETLRFRIAEIERSYALTPITAEVSITLWKGLGRVECSADVDWDDYNHQLRVVLPLAFQGRHCYEVPYGMLERPEYPAQEGWAAACGDWPAINWMGAFGEECACVLLNRGLPGCRIEETPQGSELQLSLLRSPTIPTYLHEPASYVMRDWEGMRDCGKHSFRFGMASFAPERAVSEAVAAGEAFQGQLMGLPGRAELPELPTLAAGSPLRITAWKKSEDGKRWILRLYNPLSGDAAGELRLPDWAQTAGEADWMEQPVGAWSGKGSVSLEIPPYKIRTYYFEK